MKGTFELPKESTEGFSHTAEINGKVYDVYKLIEFAKTIQEKIVPLSVFDNSKESKFWKVKENICIGPSDVIDVLEEHAESVDWEGFVKKYPDWKEHIESIRDADYEKYPIIYTGDDLIVDGMHRLTKAWIDEAKEIKVKWIESLPDSAIDTRPMTSKTGSDDRF